MINKYLECYKTHTEGTTSWTENKGTCYYLGFQHCLLELKTELKNSALWEGVASDTDIVSLLPIIRDVFRNKQEWAQSMMGLV